MKSLITLAIVACFFVACDNKESVDKTQPTAKTVEAAATPADKAEATTKTAPLAAAGKLDCAGHGESEDCPFGDEKNLAKAELGCGAHAAAENKLAAAGDGVAHFGADFTLTDAAPLASALEAAKDESTVKVSGTIAKVCAKKGCWMVVKDGDAEARVVMKGYAFTVPTDSKGKDAVVEGTLKVKTFTEAQAKHLAEDGGEDPSKVTGERKEFLLTATSIDIKS